MTIELLYFGQLKDALRRNGDRIEADAGVTVRALLSDLQTGSEWQALRALPLTFAVNDELVADSHVLQDGDRVALLPPVSGG